MIYKLPKEKHAIVDLAYDCLVRAEQNLLYQINMAEWHSLKWNGVNVCLAGCIMAFHLKKPWYKSYTPSDFGQEKQIIFHMLADISVGYVKGLGLSQENISYLESIFCTYNESPEKFKHYLMSCKLMLQHGVKETILVS